VGIRSASDEWYQYIYTATGENASIAKYIIYAACLLGAFVIDFFMVRNPAKVIVGMGFNMFMRKKYGDTFVATNTPINNGTLVNMTVVFVIGVVISGFGQMLGIGITTATAHKKPDIEGVNKLDEKRAKAVKEGTKIEQANFDRLLDEQTRAREQAKAKITSTVKRKAKENDPDALATIKAADTAGDKYNAQITAAQTKLEQAKAKVDKDFDGEAGIVKGVAEYQIKSAVELSNSIVGSSHKIGLLALCGGIFVSITLAVVGLKTQVDEQMQVAGVTELVEVKKGGAITGYGPAGGRIANP
jgi:hypothetical protein